MPKSIVHQVVQVFNTRDRKAGIESLIRDGETLLIFSPDITVKTFTFDACLTDNRLFFLEPGSSRSAVPAKEIPREAIRSGSIEFVGGIPVLVLSVKTSDDMRTMKLRFEGKGPGRTEEVEDWVSHLTRHGGPVLQKPVPLLEREEKPIPAPPAAPVKGSEAPGLADTRISYCHQCGRKLPEIANFCPFCGIRLRTGETLPEPEKNERGTQIFRKLLRR